MKGFRAQPRPVGRDRSTIRPTLDQALGGPLAVHEMLIEARTKHVLADEEFFGASASGTKRTAPRDRRAPRCVSHAATAVPEGLYTLAWTRTAVADVQKLDPEVAHHVLNNVPTLVRDPFPPFSDATGEGWYLLHVGAASVAYEVTGFTVTLLAIHTIGTGHR